MQNEFNDNPVNTLGERIKINSVLAIKFYNDKEYQKAADYYNEILKGYYSISTLDTNIKDHFPEINQAISVLKTKIYECYLNLGETYYNNKEYENAINSFKTALTYGPGDYEIYYKLGISFRSFKMFEAAIIFLKKTIQLNPSFEEVYKVIGDIFILDKKIKEEEFKAYKYYSKFITLNKSNGYVYNNLAYLLMDSLSFKYKTIAKQIEYFNAAIDLLPEDELPLKNIALVYASIGEYDKAKGSYEKLIQKFPNGTYLFPLSLFQMKTGQVVEGLKNYEHRLTALPHLNKLNKNKPIWKGTSLKNKRILIVWEQAFGDNIQLVRYLPFLEQQSQKVIYKPQKELYSLMKRSYPSIEVIPDNTDWDKIKFDSHNSLISLPYYLNLAFDNIPYKEGYLKADPERIANFKKEFFENKDLKIGIHWKCGSRGMKNKIVNENRIVNIEAFFPIIKLENVKAYSLQKTDAEEDLKSLPEDIKLINLCDKIKDFDDSAAMIKNMDLVITNDSSMVHLAGSLGKKTFLLIPKDSDWKWFLDEETTPWYSSVRIFKQTEFYNWAEVMNRVLNQIKQDYDLK